MAKKQNKLVIEAGKRENFKGVLSELDKARRKYDEGYQLRELVENQESFTGVALSNMIEPKKEDGNPFAYLEFYNDDDETFTKVGVNFKFKTKTPAIFEGSKLFPILQAVTGDMESTYFKVDYKVLQETLKKITAITIEGVEVDTGDFEYISYKVIDLKME